MLAKQHSIDEEELAKQQEELKKLEQELEESKSFTSSNLAVFLALQARKRKARSSAQMTTTTQVKTVRVRLVTTLTNAASLSRM